MKIKPGQLICLDTNILLDATDEGRALHKMAIRIFGDLFYEGFPILLATQVLREYMVVATRRIEENGLGLSLEDAVCNVRQFLRRGSLAAESTDAFEMMLEWSLKKEIRGKKFHDLQIMATAASAGADVLLTSNVDDFPKGPGIAIVALKDLEFPRSGSQ
jgi:predicted nucleic acid-binding protein